MVTRSVFVESWTRRTVTPGNRASVESVTVPVIEARPDCAYAPTLKSTTNIASRMLVYISDSSYCLITVPSGGRTSPQPPSARATLIQFVKGVNVNGVSGRVLSGVNDSGR